MRLARLAFAFLATIWVVLLATAPSASLGAPVSGVVYLFGSLICHQRPERSFHIGLGQLPVCARCYGVYVGAAIGALAAIKGCTTVGSRLWALDSGDLRRTLRLAIILAASPTAVTWLSELSGLWSPSNRARFIAALPLGAAVAVTVNYVECVRPPRLGFRRPQTPT